MGRELAGDETEAPGLSLPKRLRLLESGGGLKSQSAQALLYTGLGNSWALTGCCLPSPPRRDPGAHTPVTTVHPLTGWEDCDDDPFKKVSTSRIPPPRPLFGLATHFSAGAVGSGVVVVGSQIAFFLCKVAELEGWDSPSPEG